MAEAPHPAPAPSLNDIQRKLSIHSPPALSPRPSVQAPETADAAASVSTTSAPVHTVPPQTAPVHADSDPEDEERVEGARTLDRQAVIKTGYLYKKGQRRKVWQKRFFVLRPQHIAYYKDEREYKLLRDIPLYSVRTCAPVQLKKHLHVFGIVTPDRTYYVEASSDDQLAAWVAAINSTRDHALASQGPSNSGSISDDLDHHSSVLPLASPPPPPAISVPPSSSSAPIPIASSLPPQPSSSYTPAAFSDAGTLSSSVSSQYSPTAPLPPSTLLTAHHDDINSNLVSLPPPVSSPSAPTAVQSIVTSFNPIHTQTVHSQGPISPGVASSSEDDEDDYVADLPASLQRTQLSASTSSAGSINPNTAPKPPQQHHQLQQLQQLQQPDINLSHLDPNKVIFAGYLTKQGKRKNWRKRWFILVSTRLYYCKSHMDRRTPRQIPLSSILDAVEYEPPIPSSPRLGSRQLSQLGKELSSGGGGSGGGSVPIVGSSNTSGTGTAGGIAGGLTASSTVGSTLPPSLSHTSGLGISTPGVTGIGGDSYASGSAAGTSAGNSLIAPTGPTSGAPAQTAQVGGSAGTSIVTGADMTGTQQPSSSNTEKKKYENCFKIITAKRTFLVCAPTEEDEIKWLSALRVLISASRHQSAKTGPAGSSSLPPSSSSTNNSSAAAAAAATTTSTAAKPRTSISIPSKGSSSSQQHPQQATATLPSSGSAAPMTTITTQQVRHPGGVSSTSGASSGQFPSIESQLTLTSNNNNNNNNTGGSNKPVDGAGAANFATNIIMAPPSASAGPGDDGGVFTPIVSSALSPPSNFQHRRNRSITDAAKEAVENVEKQKLTDHINNTSNVHLQPHPGQLEQIQQEGSSTT